MAHTFGSSESLYDESSCSLCPWSRKVANVDTAKFSSAVAALTLAFSRGCGAEVNTDDILMVAMKLLGPGKFPYCTCEGLR